MNQPWFSARVRLLTVVEGRAFDYSDSIVVFRASDFGHAFERALQLGRQLERHYLNAEGGKVAQLLKEIVALDAVGEEVDGVEVYYESLDLPEGEEDVMRLRPEDSRPQQTILGQSMKPRKS